MHVFLTGAFGLIGVQTLTSLLEQGHTVRCLDQKTSRNLRRYKPFRGRCEVVWGDLRDREQLTSSLVGVDAVIHNAGIIPPRTETHPELAYDINVNGTEILLQAMKQSCPQARLVFASSFSLYPHDAGRKSPITLETPIEPTDEYTRHKATCEEMIQASSFPWTILRIAAAIRSNDMPTDPGLLRIFFTAKPETRVEVVDTRDVGLAQANAVTANGVCNKILLIGGGECCQVTFADLFQAVADMLNCGSLPPKAFGQADYYTDWLDTSESQSLLNYQRYSFAEYRKEVTSKTRYLRWFLRLLRPLTRQVLLFHSPSWKQRKQVK